MRFGSMFITAVCVLFLLKLQWLEREADCNKVGEDAARLIYFILEHARIVFGISLLRK